jgi:hypothetical protein
MLGFNSPKKCVQRREGLEPGQELIRDLLILSAQWSSKHAAQKDWGTGGGGLHPWPYLPSSPPSFTGWPGFFLRFSVNVYPQNFSGKTNRTGCSGAIIYLLMSFLLCQSEYVEQVTS